MISKTHQVIKTLVYNLCFKLHIIIFHVTESVFIFKKNKHIINYYKEFLGAWLLTLSNVFKFIQMNSDLSSFYNNIFF